MAHEIVSRSAALSNSDYLLRVGDGNEFMKTHIGLLALLFVAFAVSGCTYRNGYPTQSDGEFRGKLSDAQIEYIWEDSTGFTGKYEDLHAGSGGQVFPTRRAVLDIVVADPSGVEIGKGRFEVLYPKSELVPSGSIDPTLFQALYGMRVGGTRRIYMTSSCPGRTDVPCELSGLGPGAPHLQYPNSKPMVFTVTAVSACRPWIIVERLPDILGGGPGRKVKEILCW